MARAYQESHILDNLTSSVKTLQSQTTDLSKAKGLHEERITNLLKQNEQQAKKIEALETRISADEHNTTARIQNAHLALQQNPHAPLTPLHDLSTDRPIRHFPKHERDVKTMGASEVIQVLQALDVKVLGMSPAEKKAEVRVQVGLPRDGEAAPATTAPTAAGVEGKGVGAAGAARKVHTDGSNEKEKVAPGATKAPLPKVAPGSTAEKKGKVGGSAVEGVSKPTASAAPKAGAEKKA